MKLIYIFLECHILRYFWHGAILDEIPSSGGGESRWKPEKWKTIWTLNEPDILQVDIMFEHQITMYYSYPSFVPGCRLCYSESCTMYGTVRFGEH